MKRCCCGMCVHWDCGKCTKHDNERVDCLEKRCDDFKGFFDKGD